VCTVRGGCARLQPESMSISATVTNEHWQRRNFSVRDKHLVAAEESRPAGSPKPTVPSVVPTENSPTEAEAELQAGDRGVDALTWDINVSPTSASMGSS
jgi:hypothetical protein